MYVKCFAQIKLVFRSLYRIFGLWPKIGCISEMKINLDLFCISLDLHYLCTHETSSTQEEPRPAFPD